MRRSEMKAVQPASEKQPTLGKLLRGLRTRHDWTLREMSDRSGIPVSTLSKVEHDRLTLTYDKLLLLSQRLDMRLSDLFAEADDGPEAPVTARRSIGQLDRAIQVTTANYDYYYLCPELRQKRMIPTIATVCAKTMAEFGDLVRHSGEEFIYVLEGSVAVHTEFYDPITLHPGQSIYIDSQMGHAYLVGEGFEEAKILGVCSSTDEAFMNWLTHLRDAMANGSLDGIPPTIENLHHYATGRKVSRLGEVEDVDG